MTLTSRLASPACNSEAPISRLFDVWPDHPYSERALGFISLGMVVGAVAAMGVLTARRALNVAAIGHGHSLKHRLLDMAAGTMQRKYPVSAMSTYLNAFHMYADDMGRQVEATHTSAST